MSGGLVVWVVTEPSPVSTVGDCVFPATLERLELQFRGGLDVREEKAAMFLTFEEAIANLKARCLAASFPDCVTYSRVLAAIDAAGPELERVRQARA